MKYIQNLCILFVFCYSSVNAQQQNSITVFGETIKIIEIEKYLITVEFREIVGDNYTNVSAKSIAELKKEYASMLSKVNINFDQFKEDVYYNITSTLYNYSSQYYYETSSLEEVKRIISQKMKGIGSARVDIISKEISNEQIAALNKKAIDDARARAQQIASKVGKKAKEVIRVEDLNYKYDYFNSVGIKKPSKYYVKVTFSLE
ncbi:SIMPL domain-containing protein [uncultured Aquimarina sp.]|uniref:SIMPL domain-containing protein n=1 Tax=uncultured Aquimarina sp. TaxID=575652 RepID=UPI0026184D11|nr:SIMPL domain-containing protein [uncultured Aquimarina sp.]